jgi:putative two-component system response regulator
MVPFFGPRDLGDSDLFGEPERLDLLRQAAHILVVDDEPANIGLLTAVLRRAGFQSVIGLTDATLVEESIRQSPPDLVLLDLHMPGRDGIAVLKALRPMITGDRLPVIVLTGDGSPAARHQALQWGAKDFVTKPFDMLEVVLRVRNLLETRLLFQDLRKHNRALLESSHGRTRELESTRIEMVERLALAAEYRDDNTNQHNQRVGGLAARIAGATGLPPADVALIARAAALHDIGKIGIPDALLRKAGALTPAEMLVMHTHTTIGARIVGGSQFALLQLAETIALSHHERWDGSGYPRGLRGEHIPLPGRIVAVADAFDAMTTDRPYRAALPIGVALDRLRDARDRQFDRRVVDTLITVLDDNDGPWVPVGFHPPPQDSSAYADVRM